MSLLDEYRNAVFREALELGTVETGWPIWRQAMSDCTANFSDPEKVIGLGAKLSEVFALTSKKGTQKDAEKRSQGEVTSAGTSWEFLIFFYLNLILSGTNGICLRPIKSQVPSAVYDATTINYHNERTNTESDLLVLVFPDRVQALPGFGPRVIDHHFNMLVGETDLHIIQCKTNWRDNAQVPMLWDMIYRIARSKVDATILSSLGISIGSGVHHIQNFRSFSYSFCTVPTGKDDYKASLMPVKRVLNLSGGNFWGKPFRAGVSRPLSDMFQRNLHSAFDRPILDSVRRSIDQKLGIFALL